MHSDSPHGRKKKKSPGGRPRPRGKSAPRPESAGTLLRARKLPDQDAWELVHPRCARDRALDLEEVRKMVEAGELEIATDECRWLLNGCSDCVEAHRILGEIALEENDLPLARGHFGYAYRLGEQALAKAGTRGPLPYAIAANQGFLESAKGLAFCLKRLDKPEMAQEVVALALACDPGDPLRIQDLLKD